MAYSSKICVYNLYYCNEEAGSINAILAGWYRKWNSIVLVGDDIGFTCGYIVIYKDSKYLMIFNYILGLLMLHKFVDTNVVLFFFFFFYQNGCSFWGRENSNKQSLQSRLRMGKKSHMKMPQLHWRGLSISIQPCKLVMVIGQLKMLAHCSSFHPWWVSSLNSIIVIDTSWNTN